MTVGNKGVGVPHTGAKKSADAAEFLPPPDWPPQSKCSVVNNHENDWPQMNTDEHRCQTNSPICVHLCSSAANQSQPSNQAQSRIREPQRSQPPQRSPYSFFLLPSASQRLCGEYHAR